VEISESKQRESEDGKFRKVQFSMGRVRSQDRVVREGQQDGEDPCRYLALAAERGHVEMWGRSRSRFTHVMMRHPEAPDETNNSRLNAEQLLEFHRFLSDN
jgi:hypothetical protein